MYRKLENEIRIGLIGFGLHARQVYWKCLKKLALNTSRTQPLKNKRIQIPLLIDTHNQQSFIDSFLESELQTTPSNLIPTSKLYIAPKINQYNQTKQALHESVCQQINESNCNLLIIATDPRFRKPYLKHAIDNNIRVLCDKPVFLHSCYEKLNLNMDINAGDVFESEFFEIYDSLLIANESDITLMCQRRRHEAYVYLIKYLSDFIQEFQIPINYIHINHNDGLYLTPNEAITIENHPFKYGYGKLINSGYHFVDLLLWLQDINKKSLQNINCDDKSNHDNRKIANEIELCCTRRYSIYDDFYANCNTTKFGISNSDDSDSVNDDTCTNSLDDYYKSGELDCYNLLQFRHNNNICNDTKINTNINDNLSENKCNVITTASLQLLHKSFSRRGWRELPIDVNKKNGRIRHELITITVGCLLTIHLRSFQSFEETKLYQNENNLIKNAYDNGGTNHFEIDIFRNTQLCGGLPYENINFGRDYTDYNQFESLMFEARFNVLRDFLLNNCHDMSVKSKNARDTVRLLSAMYKTIAINNSINTANDDGRDSSKQPIILKC